MAVRIADTLKQQNDLKTFPVAFSEDIWIDKNKGEGTADYKDLQALYNEGSLGGSGLPKPESKDKLLLSTENTETSELEWSQVDKYKAVEIPLYETKAAAEADIANLSDGQIIATKDEGNENAKPVDVVESGNMHAVTSNAVANFALAKSKIRTGIVYGGSANNDNWVATFDTPFADSNYTVIVTPQSSSGASNCPNGWYVVSLAATGFSVYCSGNAPKNGFHYIAIHN